MIRKGYHTMLLINYLLYKEIMKNYKLPKEALFSTAFALSTFLGTYAQAPLTSYQGSFTAKTSAPSEPVVYPNFVQCPSGRLTNQFIQENGLQQLQALGQYQREHTQAADDPNRAVRTVPVIFHIVYNTTAENVSNTVINNLLLRLNQDFRKNNSLISSIRASFQSVATDAQIEFCLATKDPNGNTLATPGIDRVQTSLTYFNPDATNNGINYASGGVGGPNSMKGATYGAASWDRTKYINIWICDITNGANYGTAGYAYVPACTTTACLPTANIDGIVLDYNIGVENGSSHAISHEMGHFFGLDHTFADNDGYYNDGQSTCGPAVNDDGFSDTPKIRGPFQNNYASCASATTVQSCTSGALWQYENLMDYSDCFSMFTAMQSTYMNNVLSGGRNSLVTSTTTNCAAASPTVPVANFSGCNASVAQNSTVTFTDLTTGVPTSWSWSITPATGWAYVGGTSSSSQNPQVQFTTPGTYTVALTATNALGSNTKTSASCITVVAVTCNTLTTAFSMGFEASESLSGWAVENTNGDDDGQGNDNTWFTVSASALSSSLGSTITAHGGDGMAMYYWNEDGVTSANDWLYTPCFSLQSGNTYTISFWYKVANSSYAEKMRVKLGSSQLSTTMTQTIVDLGSKTNTTWVQQTSTFTVTTSGDYYVGFQCYSDADKYFLLLDDINISKQSSGVQAPAANFTGCGSYVTGNTVTFTNTSTNSPTSNSWNITPATGWAFANGTSATSASPQVTFTVAGSYTVSLTATNAGGSNTKTTSSCVVVSAGSGLEDLNFASGISLYPNPTTGLTTISIGNINEYSNLRVNVYNAIGELVYSMQPTNSETTVDLSAFSKGIYFVEIRSNEAVATKRVVLNK